MLDVQAIEPGATKRNNLDIVLVKNIKNWCREVVVHEHVDRLATSGKMRAVNCQRDIIMQRRAYAFERLQEFLHIAPR